MACKPMGIARIINNMDTGCCFGSIIIWRKTMSETITQKRSEKELKDYCDLVINLLSPLNIAEKYKVVKTLYDSLLDTIKQEGIIIEYEHQS
jgi:hypothetical protein